MAKNIRPLKTTDLYKLVQPYGLSLNPDGSQLAGWAEEPNEDTHRAHSNLWLQPVTGGARRQFTRGKKNDHSAEFSPDGKLIAFLSNRSGKSQLHVIPSDGGESWQLTELDGSVSEFAWSPDSSEICIVFTPADDEALEREKQRKQGKEGLEQPRSRVINNFFYKLDGAGFLPESPSELRMVKVSTGKVRELFKDEFYNTSPTFTPDGKYVVFASNKHPDYELEPNRTDLWKIRTDGKGRLTKIDTHEGPAGSPEVSPDGKLVAFVGYGDAELFWHEVNPMLYVVSITGGEPVNLSEKLDRPVGNLSINDTWGLRKPSRLMWSPDGSEIYAQVTVDGNTEIYRFDVKDGGGVPVFSEPGVVLDFAIDFERQKLYCLLSDMESPGDYYVRNLEAGKLKRLSKINSSLFNYRDLGAVEEVWVKGKGGHKIQGWVMTPPGFNPRRKYPAILYIHGGPHVAYARALVHEFNYLAGEGYVVLYCNPRGSHGYGQQHLAAISEKWGENDYDDLLRFTEYVVDNFKFIDKDRLGVTGGSYGGYMTNWIIGHDKRFKAAVTQRCVSNFLSFMGSSDVGFMFHYEFGSKEKTPWQDIERFLELSPMKYIPEATTPTLVIHSENDLRCPIEQGEQVYVQLKLQGVDTGLVRFPEESHGLSRGGRTDRRIERLEHIKGWMDKYLGTQAKPKKRSNRKKKKQ